MKVRLSVLFAVLVVACTASTAAAIAPLTLAQKQSGTVQLTTNTSFDHATFMKVKRGQFTPSMWGAARLPNWSVDRTAFDWADDGCSVPGGLGVALSVANGYFNEQCQRHDFCYRNTKRFFDASGQATHKGRCDNTFNADMTARCNRFNAVTAVPCHTARGVIIGTVRALGGLFY